MQVSILQRVKWEDQPRHGRKIWRKVWRTFHRTGEERGEIRGGGLERVGEWILEEGTGRAVMTPRGMGLF